MRSDPNLKKAVFPKKRGSFLTLKCLFCEGFMKMSFFGVRKWFFETLDDPLFCEEIVGCFGRLLWGRLGRDMSFLDGSPSQTLRNPGPSWPEANSPPVLFPPPSRLKAPPVDTEVHTSFFKRQKGFSLNEDLVPTEVGVISSILLRFLLEVMTWSLPMWVPQAGRANTPDTK